MIPGESPLESACRILKRELGMVFEPKLARNGGRFVGVGAYSYAWQFRQQTPQDRGLADVSLVLTVEISKKERDQIRLDYSTDLEYHGHEWVQPHTLRDDATKHPALRRAAADLIAGAAWRTILLDAPKLSDADLGKRLRESGLMDEMPSELAG